MADADESVCTPGSVLRMRAVAAIHLGPALPLASSDLPAGMGRAIHCLLLDLAPGGVYLADAVTRTTGGLLPRLFTLTACTAVCFLWHCPSGRPGWPLAITLPCGARTFLESRSPRGRPTDSSARTIIADRCSAPLFI